MVGKMSVYEGERVDGMEVWEMVKVMVPEG